MAQKYIIGDLVRYTSLYKEPIAEICEIRETSYLIRYMNGNFAKVTNEEIKPIPLTKEILEKNGWKRNGGQYSFTFKSYVGDKVECIGFFIEMFKNVHDMLKHKYFQIFLENKNIYGCFYVHQLQHLLFGLGLNHEMEV